MIVAVGSSNPTKIRPVRSVFSHFYPKSEVIGVAVKSGIKAQPLNDLETYQGALNRAINAINIVKNAEFGVGIEGGLNQTNYGWFERSLVVIVDRKGKIGVGSSGGLILPQKVIDIIKQGKTLEDAIDQLCHTKKIGKGIGMFGVFTNRMVTRSQGVKHGVAFAMARFLHPELYD
jgi:inosine/xanthosine triphosphatase